MTTIGLGASEAPCDRSQMGNVTATVRIGSRVMRCIGVDGVHSHRKVRAQLDLFMEHARREAQRRRPTTPNRRCQDSSLFEL